MYSTRVVSKQPAHYSQCTGRTPSLAQAQHSVPSRDRPAAVDRPSTRARTRTISRSRVQQRHGYKNKQKHARSPRARPETVNPIPYHPLHARHKHQHGRHLRSSQPNGSSSFSSSAFRFRIAIFGSLVVALCTRAANLIRAVVGLYPLHPDQSRIIIDRSNTVFGT